MPRHLPPEVLARLRSKFPVPAYVGAERRFFSSHEDGFSKDPRGRQYAYQRAAEAGVDVSGAKYFPSLADSVGDPKAWVRDKHDIAQRAAVRGVGIEAPGFRVDAPNVEIPDDKPYEVAPDIVEKELDIVVDKEYGGEVSPQKREDLYHEIKAKRSNVKFGDE